MAHTSISARRVKYIVIAQLVPIFAFSLTRRARFEGVNTHDRVWGPMSVVVMALQADVLVFAMRARNKNFMFALVFAGILDVATKFLPKSLMRAGGS